MTIQYIMLVSLGFLIASLIALLLAPIFWHRAVRLTSTKLRQSLPLSEQEILADKDQLRAKYAIRVHQLEKQVEQATIGGARQKINLNRRDASISQLEAEINRLKSEFEESQNARGVLEQTVGDRIPKIEAKLEDARKLLVVRDRDISELSQSSRRQAEALNEARVINQKQASDIERLRSQVLAYEAQSRKGAADGELDGELALRTELEMLRARTLDQTSLLDRLNAELTVSRAAVADSGANGRSISFNGAANDATAGDGAVLSGDANALIASQRREIAILQTQLESAKAASEAAAALVSQHSAGIETAVERELRTLKAQAEDQAAEITRLRAEVAASMAEAGMPESAVPSLRENRIALKARVGGLEAKSNQQNETIQRLRAELAQANERAARQASSFMDEMRRLGVAAHITQPRTGRPASPQDTTRARNVARRTQAVFEASRTPVATPAGNGAIGDAGAEAGSAVLATTSLGRRLVASSIMGAAANGDAAGAANGSRAADSASPRVSTLVAALRGNGPVAGEPNGQQSATASTQGATASTLSSAAEPAVRGLPRAPSAASSDEPGAPRVPRLIDRITAADGTS